MEIFMSKELEGKVTVITGASAGIGRATALLCAREGAKLVLSDIDEAGGHRLVEDIVAMGGEATFMRADASSQADIRAMLDHAIATHGVIDCVFNNVGIPQLRRSILEIPLEEWNRVITVNLTGCFLALQLEIPLLLTRPRASIVNMASFSGVAATPLMAAYSSSKFGVIGLTKSAAAEFARTGLRINAVCPTATLTPGMVGYLEKMGVTPEEAGESYPAGRMAQPEEMAEVVLWLLSDRSSYINGQAICATGGPSGITV
jgi:NAD(P)-dependent dehydrogenase (short-subunit alcohol dehydrogenase family)